MQGNFMLLLFFLMSQKKMFEIWNLTKYGFGIACGHFNNDAARCIHNKYMQTIICLKLKQMESNETRTVYTSEQYRLNLQKLNPIIMLLLVKQMRHKNNNLLTLRIDFHCKT